MGFFGQVINSTTRKIEDYQFSYIDNLPSAISISDVFQETLDSTKWLTWGSDCLNWYQYGDDNNGFKADFIKKIDDGRSIYMWVLDNDNKLIIMTSKFGETLELQYFAYEEIVFSANVDLIKY